MDYLKVYNQIVDRAKNRDLINQYVEKHHIIPRCMGGSDEKQNIASLTAREHYICHWLLTRIYPANTKLGYAFWAMSNQKSQYQQDRYTPSSRAYLEAKEHCSKLSSQERTGVKKWSEEAKANMSLSRQGVLKTDTHKANIREYAKNRTLQHREKIRAGKTGIPHRPETKEKIRNSLRTAREQQGWKSPNNRPVAQFLRGVKVAEFESAADAIRKTGIKGVTSCTTGRQKTSGGYEWKYL